jgi:hypothetical protein
MKKVKKDLMRWIIGERVGVFAFAAFDALTARVTDVRFLADASRRAFQVGAFRWDLRNAANQERERGAARGQAVQLVTAVGVEFAIGGAFAFDLSQHHGVQWSGDWSFAVGGGHADALIVPQIAFFAEATDDAVASADGTRVGIGAGGRASGTARFEVLVERADWWEHLERLRLDLSGAFAGFDALAGFRSQITAFAGATGNADARAQRVRVLARTVATFALTEFFVLAAHARLDRHGVFGASAAVLGGDARALSVLQETGFAEATDDALFGAHARLRVFAARRASGAARQEDLVFFALRQFRWIGEEHVILSSIAFAGLDADALIVPHITLFAEAADHAVLGADRARVGVGAGGSASGAARVEIFVGRAFGSGVGFLHGNIVNWEGWNSHSIANNAEQQQESKAKGHR